MPESSQNQEKLNTAEQNGSGADKKIFRRIQIVCWLLILLIVVLMVCFNASDFSLSSLSLFAKEMATAFASSSEEGTDYLLYTVDDGAVFDSYKNGIVVVDSNELFAFSASGRQTLDDQVSVSSPAVCTNGSYMLIYDQSGNAYYFYNSYSCTYSNLEASFPVEKAAVTSNGYYAIISRSADTTTCVYLYNASSRLIQTYSSDGYITDVAFSENNDRLYFISIDSKDGMWYCKVCAYKTGTQNRVYETELDGVAGYQCFPLSSGNIAVLCDNKIVFINSKGNIMADVEQPADEITDAHCDSGYLAVASNSGNVSTVRIYNSKGKNIYQCAVESPAIDICVNENYLFVRTEEGITRINYGKDTSESVRCSESGKSMVMMNTTGVVLCSSSKAVYYSFN